jgi:hypothetical protein
MKKVHYDITPDIRIVDSIRNTNITYVEAIGELVDNSLDSGATRVEIQLPNYGGCLVVADNGNGCDNIESMLKLGKHHKTNTTRLGRYGVGLKNASIGIGKLLTIETVKGGIKRRVEVDWNGMNSWNDIEGTEDETNGPAGTTIVIGQTVKSIRSEGDITKKLGFTFFPAIRDGKSIAISGKAIKPWSIPEMSDAIESEDFNYEFNVGYKVTAGLVNRNDEGPFILSFRHRVLGAISEPCKAFNVNSRFMALVELTGEWPMLKHKDGLTYGPESQWLYDSLHDDCQDLMAQLHKEGESVEVEQMSQILDLAISPIRGKAKRPNRNNSEVESERAFTDRIVREAEMVANAGDVSRRDGRSNRRGFSTAYDNLPPNEIGRVDRNHSRVVIKLNENHPLIKLCRDNENRIGTLIIATMIFTAHTSIDGTTQELLKFEVAGRQEGFQKSTSMILENIFKAMNSTSLVK